MSNNPCCGVDVDKCDTFEFMQNVIGLPILHPGGLKATDRLARLCEIDASKRVLDIACGPGLNDDYLVRARGCSMVGVDVNGPMILKAQERVRKNGLAGKLSFLEANAQKLPFDDNEFDATLFEAVLIMVDDEEQAVREAVRVTKPRGYVGVLELTWKSRPPASFFEEARDICSFFRNAKTAEEWRKLIFGDRLTETSTETYAMECPCGWREMGLERMIRVFLKEMLDSKVRNRMKALDDFVNRHDQYFGYGIYVGRKP